MTALEEQLAHMRVKQTEATDLAQRNRCAAAFQVHVSFTEACFKNAKKVDSSLQPQLLKASLESIVQRICFASSETSAIRRRKAFELRSQQVRFMCRRSPSATVK